ncbi:MAG: ATPase, T2SS/T4P/T4SS family [Verrucomicrobiales bacterium]
MKNSEPESPNLCSAFTAAVSAGRDDGSILAHHLVEDAIAARATDIHIDPQQDRFLIRFRIDGRLHDAADIPRPEGEALTRSIRVDAEIDPATRPDRLEGTAHLGPRDSSARVAFASTVKGPKLSLRLLEAARVEHEIGNLGMEEPDEKALLEWASQAQGMVLCVGPTGCGKTTTCYALLREMLKRKGNLITLEDPVEFVVDGLTQVQLDAKDPSRPDTFAKGIRSILRHDPDAVFMGEIRDEPAAHAAIDASFSGHVLLSTMHARDPAGAATLLRSMGVKSYEIAASLRMVVGQRLVRLLCPDCREERPPTELEAEAAKEFGVELEASFEGKGCPACSGTGYRDRSAVFERWELTDDDYAALMKGQDENRLRAALRDRGVPSLAAAALQRARRGDTSVKEALRVR